MGSWSKHRLRGVALVLMAGLWASGCVALGGLDRTAGTIDRSAGAARNNSILLNIVRASRHEPLYFYSISRVSGSGMEDFKLNLPPFTAGPGRSGAQRNYTFPSDILDSQKSGSFDVALLDSKYFYQGMLQPLDLVEINLLLKQGFPRELVYRLAVQDVTIYAGGEAPARFINDPATTRLTPPVAPGEAPKTLDFDTYFETAMTHGITVETYVRQGGVQADDEVRSDAGRPDGGRSGRASAATDPAPKRPAGQGAPAARLCFDEALIRDPSALQDVRLSGNECGLRPNVVGAEDAAKALPSLKDAYAACKALDEAGQARQAQAKAAQASGGKVIALSDANTPAPTPADHRNQFCAHMAGSVVVAELETRSLYGIFQYLGQVMTSDKGVNLWGLGQGVEPTASGPLLAISHDRGPGCFAQVDHGAHYCIPQSGDENLKQAFSMINALQALKTSPGDLPVTAAVRIEQ